MWYPRSVVDIARAENRDIDCRVLLFLKIIICLVVVVSCAGSSIMVSATRGSKRKIDADEKEMEERVEQILQIYQTTTKNAQEGCDRWLEYRKGPLMSKLLEMKCLDLFERNMGELYKCSSWGLNMKKKKTEFQHPDSRFLILFSSNRRDVLAFAHFRLEVQTTTTTTSTTNDVLYVYELQVDESVRRCGIGQQFMEILESIAFTQSHPIITKLVLTVFKTNTNAMKFYTTKMNYQIDITSPSKTHPHKKTDYEILCKYIHTNNKNKHKKQK